VATTRLIRLPGRTPDPVRRDREITVPAEWRRTSTAGMVAGGDVDVAGGVVVTVGKGWVVVGAAADGWRSGWSRPGRRARPPP
jgi:hypothetical protein